MPIQTHLEPYFNKSFEFTGNEQWSLPSEAFKTPPWHIDTLQSMKTDLNAVKSQLSQFNLDQWSQHTRLRDPSSFIIPTLKCKGRLELLTQAWCKFYECLCRYPIVPKCHELSTLHLCEAPGAFVCALNSYLYTHRRRIKWHWTATTLNPSYEGNSSYDMISDDRLIFHTLPSWEFGLDQTGDITKYYNHEALAQKEGVLLVTADGSVDCMSDPGEQENHVHFLHYCEAMTALRVLAQGGSLVLKLFTMFEHGTVCLMYLLCCCFANVHVFKPCSSKSGNSEVYVVCLKFKGRAFLEHIWELLVAPYRGVTRNNLAMFSLSQLPLEFLRQLEQCAEYFMQLQTWTINENVRHFTGEACPDYEDIDGLKAEVAEYFVKKCPVSSHLPKKWRLIKNFKQHRQKLSGKWDFKTVSIGDSLGLLLFDIQIGKALESITTTKFCSVSLSVPPKKSLDPNKLLQTVGTFLPANYSVIQSSNFTQHTPQHVFQREFLHILEDRLSHCSDIVIVAIPLLTRVLVGLVYILAMGFESVLASRKGVLVLRKPTEERFAVVRRYFAFVASVYLSIKEDKFAADVLQIVSSELLESGSFYEMICRYNDGLYEE